MQICTAQSYDKQDSLRGSITPEREWWDLTYYHLNIIIDIEKHSIKGSNKIQYQVLEDMSVIQIDLQPPMEIERITQDDNELSFIRNGNAVFITLKKDQIPGDINEVVVEYFGSPRVAPRPPWDSGMVWEQDSLGNPFAASISWGAGSSQWWPCKDHMYDEVDSMKISLNVREDLKAVANGKLIGVEKLDNKTTTYHWSVSNPINSYGVNFNIGNYSNFSEIYAGESGPLTCDYFVLEQNLDLAKEQFKQVPEMLEAFEFWFGPYPFYEDNYKLVEVPYLGMEHQSATAYGNGYQNGYRGADLSNTGWGKKFDYIIIHESGHEWFACNITFKDIADIWIHESFTTYSEGLFVEYHYGKEAGYAYQIGIRTAASDRPMIGDYHVNDINYSGDNYNKGAGVLHMLRQIVNDDDKWRAILRGLNKEFYHQTVTTSEIENFISQKSDLELTQFWNQYLRTTQIPTLEYMRNGNRINYRWANSIDEFDMPIKVFLNGQEKWLYPTTNWSGFQLEDELESFEIDHNFYISILNHNLK